MIQHTVAFRLQDQSALSIEQFLERCWPLGKLDGVEDFQVLEQVGKKSSFSHALSMFFEDQVAYDRYNNHPDHLAFVETVWIPNVAEFHELDYQQLQDQST